MMNASLRSNSLFRLSLFKRIGLDEVAHVGHFKTILEASKIDVDALRKWCKQSGVPSSLRARIWKVLLGISPVYQENDGFVEEQNVQQYHDLKRSVQFISLPVLLTMSDHNNLGTLLVDTYFLHLSLLGRHVNENKDMLVKVAGEFLKIFDEESDAYWCFFHFMDKPVTGSFEIFKRINIDDQLSQSPIVNNPRLSSCVSNWMKYHFITLFPSQYILDVWELILIYQSLGSLMLSIEILRVFRNEEKNIHKLHLSVVEAETVISVVKTNLKAQPSSPSQNSFYRRGTF
eukprot:TRINITY_DN8087_c0_g1_i1.p1 TRINITY_DN8087_c0_g1~~TRINITY_DN8087_c0_g1_i1.p1  ORF type:complete len:288 (-),score=42.33 TRINITY_DN8087_c0_g1_i1:93-956(-)